MLYSKEEVWRDAQMSPDPFFLLLISAQHTVIQVNEDSNLGK